MKIDHFESMVSKFKQFSPVTTVEDQEDTKPEYNKQDSRQTSRGQRLYSPLLDNDQRKIIFQYKNVEKNKVKDNKSSMTGSLKNKYLTYKRPPLDDKIPSSPPTINNPMINR